MRMKTAQLFGACFIANFHVRNARRTVWNATSTVCVMSILYCLPWSVVLRSFRWLGYLSVANDPRLCCHLVANWNSWASGEWGNVWLSRQREVKEEKGQGNCERWFHYSYNWLTRLSGVLSELRHSTHHIKSAQAISCKPGLPFSGK